MYGLVLWGRVCGVGDRIWMLVRYFFESDYQLSQSEAGSLDRMDQIGANRQTAPQSHETHSVDIQPIMPTNLC